MFPDATNRPSIWQDPEWPCRIVAAALALLLFSSTQVYATDVPFKLDLNGHPVWKSGVVEGVGKLENGHFSAAGTASGKSFQLIGDIYEDEMYVRVTGPLAGMHAWANCIASGSVRSPSGKVTVKLSIDGCGGAWTDSLYLDLPPGARNMAGGTSPSALPPLDMIDQTYVAVNPAKVREKPDPLSARVKTIEVGHKVTVVGRLKGQDWYLVSENDQPLGYVVIDQLMPESQPAMNTASTTSPVTSGQSTGPIDISKLDFGRYSALVIGNNDYRNGLQALKTATSDARAVAQTLRSDYGFKVTLLTNATRGQILEALAQLRQSLTWDDNLLIYYAGHGSYDQAGDQGYWLPVDARAQDPTNWISNADITTMLKAIQARHVMVVADSCYSGSLTRATNVDIRDASYLERMVQKKARTVMTSGGLEPVADAGSGGHSVFAASFLATLQGNTGVMDAETFFERVRRPVVLVASQTPEYSNLRSAGHEGGDFVFVRK
jgi:uncharacterized protein YgiM (DUF1202 family)